MWTNVSWPLHQDTCISFPLPRTDDCRDWVGTAKVAIKFDLLKGYWQITLAKWQQEIATFITSMGLYSYMVMAFGLRNASAFNIWWTALWVICRGMPFIYNVFIYNYDIYSDSVVVYSDTWDFHIDCIQELLVEARFTTWVFAASTVTYLGWVVDQVKLISAKFQAVEQYLVPTTDAFCSIVGSTVVAPLNNVLKGKESYVWLLNCQIAFEQVKMLICFLIATVAGVGIWKLQWRLFHHNYAWPARLQPLWSESDLSYLPFFFTVQWPRNWSLCKQ